MRYEVGKPVLPIFYDGFARIPVIKKQGETSETYCYVSYHIGGPEPKEKQEIAEKQAQQIANALNAVQTQALVVRSPLRFGDDELFPTRVVLVDYPTIDPGKAYAKLAEILKTEKKYISGVFAETCFLSELYEEQDEQVVKIDSGERMDYEPDECDGDGETLSF